jgi:hypothetical protein
MTDTNPSKHLDLPSEILTEAEKFSGLLEAAAKTRKAIVDAHVPKLAEQIYNFERQQRSEDMTILRPKNGPRISLLRCAKSYRGKASSKF